MHAIDAVGAVGRRSLKPLRIGPVSRPANPVLAWSIFRARIHLFSATRRVRRNGQQSDNGFVDDGFDGCLNLLDLAAKL